MPINDTWHRSSRRSGKGVIRPSPYCFTVPIASARLIEQLRRAPVDLLVVGSHGHGLVSDLVFGQTVDRVRHGLDLPILIARPERSAASDPGFAHPSQGKKSGGMIGHGHGGDA